MGPFGRSTSMRAPTSNTASLKPSVFTQLSLSAPAKWRRDTPWHFLMDQSWMFQEVTVSAHEHHSIARYQCYLWITVLTSPSFLLHFVVDAYRLDLLQDSNWNEWACVWERGRIYARALRRDEVKGQKAWEVPAIWDGPSSMLGAGKISTQLIYLVISLFLLTVFFLLCRSLQRCRWLSCWFTCWANANSFSTQIWME